jgi:hypothetical protein
MTGLEQLLLILIAIGFVVLLVVAIAIVLLVFKILQNVRRVTEKVELATDNLSNTISMVGRKVAPLAGSSVIGMVMKKIKKTKK